MPSRPLHALTAPCAARLSLLVLLAAAGLPPAPAAGQAEPDAVRIGLALSGGGAKGLAHVGVIRAVEEAGLRVDAVSGTSMGAVIGALYAAGYGPDSLERIVLTQDWDALLRDAGPRSRESLRQKAQEGRYLLTLPLRGGSVGLPQGLADGQQIAMLLSALFLPVQHVRDFRQLPIPFAAVSTDLADGTGVHFEQGYLPHVLRASMAIPGVFTPVELDGRRYMDGGVARNLPAEDARALGADFVICSDVGEPLLPADSLTSLVDVLGQAVGFRMSASDSLQRTRCDLLIRPDITGLSTFSFEDPAGIVRRGEAAARTALARAHVPRPSAGKRPASDRSRAPARPDVLFVEQIRIEGAEGAAERFVRKVLELDVPAQLTPGRIEAAVERLYGTGRFASATYRLEPGAREAGAGLVVHVSPREREELGIGVRYDSEFRAAALLGARFHDRIHTGSTLELCLRLGEVWQARVLQSTSLGPRLHAALLLQGTHQPLFLYEGGTRTAILEADALEAEARAGLLLFDALAVAAGLRAETYRLHERVGAAGIPGGWERLAGGVLRLYRDSFDRPAFPSRGSRLDVRIEGYARTPLTGRAFGYYAARAEARQPVSGRLSAVVGLHFGHSSGDPPEHYRFRAGSSPEPGIHRVRFIPLPGYRLHELTGLSVQAFETGAQLRIGRSLFAAARWSAARLADRWPRPFDAGDFRSGAGLSLGALTPLGPAEVTLTGRLPAGGLRLFLNLGYRF